MADEDPQQAPGTGPEQVKFWKDELARYEREFASWTQRVGKIIKRYRDERSDNSRGAAKFAMLWSNVQTMGPALYSKAPQPMVERRFLDADPVARTASITLERSIEVQLETGRFDPTMDKVKLDYLLGARGQLWVRYEPEYEDEPASGEPVEGMEAEAEEPAEPLQAVAWEKVCTEYVHWSDFAHTPARTWDEVWWVGRRIWLTQDEGVERWGDKFKRVTMKAVKGSDADVYDKADRAPRGEVWEIWDRTNRQVIFYAPDLTDEVLETKADPLGLQDFWPCPPPLYGTLTNDTLVPVPDYALYQDQANEIDKLTARIEKITRAIKAAGVYDASVPALQHLLNEGGDNKMYPVQSWATLQQTGGVKGGIEFLPIREMAEVLMSLYEAREAAKRDLYEITGMSDIIRGQASAGAPKTATEQKIKGQFASLRLEDRRKQVARFVRDTIAIIGEIVAEHFAPQTIITMTGMLENVMKELPPPPMPQAGPMQPGAQMAAPDPRQMMMLMQQQAVQHIGEALSLLKSDRLRTFRIDIETDSTVEADQVMEKEAVVEFMGALAQFMTAALPLAQAAPPLAKPLTQSLMHAMRRFKMGRAVEASFEQAFDQLQQASQQGAGQPQRDPAAEAQAVQAKATAEAAQMKAQTDVQVSQMKAQAQIQKAQMEAAVGEAELEVKQRQLAFQMRKMEMEAAEAEAAHQTKLRQLQLKAQQDAAQAAQPRPNGGSQ